MYSINIIQSIKDMIIFSMNVTCNSYFPLLWQVSGGVRPSSSRREGQWLFCFPSPMPAQGRWAWAQASLWSDGKLDDIWLHGPDSAMAGNW